MTTLTLVEHNNIASSLDSGKLTVLTSEGYEVLNAKVMNIIPLLINYSTTTSALPTAKLVQDLYKLLGSEIPVIMMDEVELDIEFSVSAEQPVTLCIGVIAVSIGLLDPENVDLLEEDWEVLNGVLRILLSIERILITTGSNIPTLLALLENKEVTSS